MRYEVRMLPPIVRSLLEVDFYKFTMMQLAWLKHKSTRARFGFKNRTNIILPLTIDVAELKRQHEYVRTLRFQSDELAYIAGLQNPNKGNRPLFQDRFLKALEKLRLPPISVQISEDGRSFEIETEGKWYQASLWETIIMNVVNRLYYLSGVVGQYGVDEKAVLEEGRRRLRWKIEILKRHPSLRFADFGLRRRWSADWQEEVLRTLRDEVSEQLLGTSNTYLAYRLGMRPIGTFAHELDMVYQGVCQVFDQRRLMSHELLLNDWWNLYGSHLSIALSDTYGSDYFIRTFGRDRASRWIGTRQDSGDPIAYGEKMIRMYEGYGIDPAGKLVVFSDGLDVDQMVRIHDHFKGRLMTTFGWGTNLTNDLGHSALSIVVKAQEVDGFPLVKLSDNLAKAMGPMEAIERIKRLAGYKDGTFEECRY